MIDGTRHGASFVRAVRGMHEWPLVIFTALAIPAAGVFAARALAELIRLLPARTETDAAFTAATIALCAGLVASLAHLGRPFRAPLALRRAGRNALSTEVALAAGLFVLGLVTLLPGVAPATRVALARAAGVLAVGLLAALGLVYFLPARWPWRSPLVAQPLTAGVAAGTVALTCLDGGVPLSRLALSLLLLDFAVWAVTWTRQPRTDDGFLPAHPMIFARRAGLIVLRLALVNALPAILVATHLFFLATIVLAVGLLVDRFAFYGLVMMRSTEAEVARIDRLIRQE